MATDCYITAAVAGCDNIASIFLLSPVRAQSLTAVAPVVTCVQIEAMIHSSQATQQNTILSTGHGGPTLEAVSYPSPEILIRRFITLPWDHSLAGNSVKEDIFFLL